MLGSAIVVFVAVLAIGQRPPVELLFNPQMIALLVMLAGFVVAWWKDLTGGIVSLAGIGSFYVLNYIQFRMFPGGWVFPLCFVPGAFMVVAGLLRRRKGR